MSYKYEIKDLEKELMEVKTIHINTDDALTKHRMKHDIELIEFQIDVFEKATKTNEYEAKARAFDAILKSYDESYSNSHLGDEVIGIIQKYGESRSGSDES